MKHIIILILTILNLSITAQIRMDTIFSNLKSGAILVRLQTKSNTINALKDKKPEMADYIKKKQEFINLGIINAFRGFSYCEVYYFYSYDSKAIKEKRFAGSLMDENLQHITEIPKLTNNYLIAEFGETNEDTAKIKLHKLSSYDFYSPPNSRLERNDETGNIEYNNTYYSSTGMEGGVDALVLLSPEFVQIQNPYPHYVRTFERLPFIARSYARTVELLQYKIEKYLNQE